MEAALRTPRTARTARPVSATSARFVRLGTASMLSQVASWISGNIYTITTISTLSTTISTLSTLSTPCQGDGPFINLARLNIGKYSGQAGVAKPLFEYIFYHENSVREAMDLAAQALQATK